METKINEIVEKNGVETLQIWSATERTREDLESEKVNLESLIEGLTGQISKTQERIDEIKSQLANFNG